MIAHITTNTDKYVGNDVMVVVNNFDSKRQKAHLTVGGRTMMFTDEQWKELLTIFRMIAG